ncbi:MAG: di-heme-cytochrome C peroxidase [Isosphaeraceae bacterium]
MRSSFILALLLAGPVAADEPGPTRDAFVALTDPLGEPVDKVVYLDQGWSPAVGLKFYFTSQGSQIIPYDWFLALEQADSQTLFRDNQNILKYRYLPQLPDSNNPDGLPVGFVGDSGVGRRWLGLTCAACHTNEIRFGTTGYRVDGAPTQGDVRALLSAMITAMQKTRDDPAKFERFAAKVLGNQNSSNGQLLLKAQLAAAIDKRIAYNLRNFPGYNPNEPAPAPADYARLDAVGAIVNEVFYHSVKAPTSPTDNTRPANAPVSYPFIWDTPQQELEQWIGIAKSGGPLDVFSLSRNVGEVLGVFADFVIPDDPSPLGYSSSVKTLGLVDLENQLKGLWSPQWPADFPPINQADAAKGKAIYQQLKCDTCHTVVTNRKNPARTIVSYMKADQTDPGTYLNFFNRTGPSGKLAGADVNLIPFMQKIPANASAATMITNEVVGTILGSGWPAPPDYLSQISFGATRPHGVLLEHAAVSVEYKARPLNGIWATAPYLHNGSVPNLDELFQPSAQRSKSFSIGVRTFDPVRVGYLTDVAGFPKFNVNDSNGNPITGNSNAGHEGDQYGTSLSSDQRRQLIEYLKSL